MVGIRYHSVLRYFFGVLFFVFVLFGTTAHAAPTFSKSFTPNTIGLGSTSRLTLTITNDSSAINSVSFVDNFPAGILIANPANISNNCDGDVSGSAGGNTISMSGGRLAPNQTCMVSVNVTSNGFIGTHTNTTGDLTSSSGNSGSATADLTVATNRPGFTKSFAPSSVSLGDRSTLTFTIDNSANTAFAASINFTDNLPTGLELADPVNATNTCVGGVFGAPSVLTANSGSGSISYSNGFVDIGSTCTISVDVVTTATGLLLNTSSELTSFSSGLFNISSGFAVAAIDVDVSTINLSKAFISDPVAPGATVELRFNIINRDRSNSASNITFSDDLNSILSGLTALNLPANDVCGRGSTISGTGVITLADGNIPAGGNCQFSVTLQVPSNATAGGYTNLTSAVTADLGGRPFTGNMASDTLFVEAGPILTKTFLSNPVGSGDTVSMEFTVTNGSSTSAASDISFTDNISNFIDGATPSGLPLSDVCGAGSSVSAYSPGIDAIAIQLSGGNLAANESCTFAVDIVVPADAVNGTNTNITDPITATIDGQTRIGNAAQATLSIVSAPQLLKQFIDDPATPGESVTLQFTLFNGEESLFAATDISFSDDLEATLPGLIATGLPINDVCGTGSTLSGSSVISLTGGNLGAAENCTFSVTLNVPTTAAPGNYPNQTSTVSATVNELQTSGAPGNDTLTIAGLNISKRFQQESVIPGGTVSMELTINNASTTLDATNIVVTDNLNNFISGTSISSPLPQSDVCGVGSTLSVAGNNFLVLSGGNLSANQSCTLSVDLIIPASAEDGIYPNVTSNLTANVGGQTLVADPGVASLELSSELIGLRKSFLDDSILLGSNTSLEFTVSNLSESETITDISFTDDLNSALSGLFATGLPVNDICGIGSSISGSGIISFAGGTLDPGASCTFAVDLSVPSNAEGIDSITNTTSSTSGLVNGLAVNGSAASDTVIVVNVDFSKSFNNPAVAGDIATLTFAIQNNGATPLDRLFFTDDLENVLSGLTANGLPVSDVCGTGSLLTGSSIITLTGGILASGESCQFSVDVIIPADSSGDFENITSALNNVPIDVAPPAIAPLEIVVRDATFSKSFDTAAEPGGSLNLSFDIQNTGSADLTNLSFTDDLDAVLAGLSASDLPASDVCGAGSSLTGTSILSLSGGSLLAGTSCQFTVALSVPADAQAGDYQNITSNLLEGEISIADSANATMEIFTRSATFNKSFEASTNPGESTNLTFEIQNTGSTNLNNLSFSDDLNSVLSGLNASGLPLSDVCGVGSSLSGNSTITLSNGNLTAGASCQFSIQVNIPADSTAGSYLNTTSALTEDGVDLSEAANASLTVNAVEPPNDNTITICHRPGTPAEKTKVIRKRALKGHLRHGDTLGACGTPTTGKIEICYKPDTRAERTKLIPKPPKRALLRHLRRGATLGACDSSNNNRKIKICHKPGTYAEQTRRIPRKALKRHLRHGDTRGACKTSSAWYIPNIHLDFDWFFSWLSNASTGWGYFGHNSSEKETLCHQSKWLGETTIRVDSDKVKNHLKHGDKKGKCSDK